MPDPFPQRHLQAVADHLFVTPDDGRVLIPTYLVAQLLEASHATIANARKLTVIPFMPESTWDRLYELLDLKLHDGSEVEGYALTLEAVALLFAALTVPGSLSKLSFLAHAVELRKKDLQTH